MKYHVPLFVRALLIIAEIILIPAFVIIALFCRFSKKSVDVGIGPHPIISHYYHKLALQLYGYTAETFVASVWHITEKFDVRADRIFSSRYSVLQKPLRYVSYLYLGVLSLARYRCLYLYFNGGAFGMGAGLLHRVEPFLYKLANVKVVVTAYGADVQEMSRSPNLLFKHVNGRDYPGHRLRRASIAADIDRWTKHANHIIGGCEWVDYMYHWDTLMLAHFSIDVDLWKPVEPGQARLATSDTKLRILHAPNHRAIKGTKYFVEAIDDLVRDGLPVELVILEGVPNDQVRSVMASVDVVADQLVIGWYAMFAMEAMALEKPVLCYLREDLERLYIAAGLIKPGEIPIINCTPMTVKETIRELISHREQLSDLGKRSREFLVKHHSLQAIGKVFDDINRSFGLEPSKKP